MPLSKEVLLDGAKIVSELIRKYDNTYIESRLPTSLYNTIFKNRINYNELNEIWKKFYYTKEKHYEQILDKIKAKMSDTAEVDDLDVWFRVTPKVKSQVQRKRYLVFKITYKQYFTVKTDFSDFEESYDNITRFLNCLPEMQKWAYETSAKYGDSVQFKFPSVLQDFLTHPDSLVVHYYRKELGSYIRTTIINSLQKRGIKLQNRIIRINSGFDFKNMNNGESDSHSMIVAKLLTKSIIKHKIELLNSSVEQIADWIKKLIIHYNKFSEEDCAKILSR